MVVMIDGAISPAMFSFRRDLHCGPVCVLALSRCGQRRARPDRLVRGVCRTVQSMTEAQEDPELRRLMDEYVQSILARNRSVPIIGEFIVSFSHMQARIEDAVVEMVGRDAKILLAGERGPGTSRSEMSFRHLLTGRAQSDAARRVINLFHGEVNELIQCRNRIAHDAWRFSSDTQEASIERRSPKGCTEVQLIDLVELKDRAEQCMLLGRIVTLASTSEGAI